MRAFLERMLVVFAVVNAIMPSGLMLFHDEGAACGLEFSTSRCAASAAFLSTGGLEVLTAVTAQNMLPKPAQHGDSCECDSQSKQRDTALTSAGPRINRSPHDSPYLFSVIESSLVCRNSAAAASARRARIERPANQLEQLRLVILLI